MACETIGCRLTGTFFLTFLTFFTFFFQNPKNDFLRFFELPHTFSRTLDATCIDWGNLSSSQQATPLCHSIIAK